MIQIVFIDIESYFKENYKNKFASSWKKCVYLLYAPKVIISFNLPYILKCLGIAQHISHWGELMITHFNVTKFQPWSTYNLVILCYVLYRG